MTTGSGRTRCGKDTRAPLDSQGPNGTAGSPVPGFPPSGGFVRLWRNGFAALGPDRHWMFVAGGLATFMGILETVMLYLIARLAVGLAAGSDAVDLGSLGPIGGQRSVGFAALLATGLLVVLIGLSVPLCRLLAKMSSRAVIRIRRELVQAYFESTWQYRISQREGQFAQFFGEYSGRTEQLVLQLGTIVLAVCQVSILLGGAVVASPGTAAVAIGGLALIGVFMRPLARRVKGSALLNSRKTLDVVSDVQQSTRLSAEISTFNVDEPVRSLLGKRVEAAAVHLNQIRFFSRLVPMAYQYSGLGVVLGVVGLLSVVAIGRPSDIAPVLLLLIRALAQTRQLQHSSQIGAEVAPFYERIEAELAALRAHRSPDGDTDISRFGTIEFRSVGFAYHPGHPVLTDVNLRITQGDVVGFIGRSGGGKTTLAHLLLGLLQPTNGEIVVDDIALSRLRRATWAHEPRSFLRKTS